MMKLRMREAQAFESDPAKAHSKRRNETLEDFYRRRDRERTATLELYRTLLPGTTSTETGGS